jgi:predicted nuclease with TOPRIM domain
LSTKTLSKINSLVLEYVKEPKTAQKIIEAIEVLFKQTEEKVEIIAKEKITEKTLENKIIIKEELRSELVTREILEEKFNVIDQRFNIIEEKFNLVDEKFNSLKVEIDEKFKRMELWFKIVIAVLIFGFFIFNPDFLDLIKFIFS